MADFLVFWTNFWYGLDLHETGKNFKLGDVNQIIMWFSDVILRLKTWLPWVALICTRFSVAAIFFPSAASGYKNRHKDPYTAPTLLRIWNSQLECGLLTTKCHFNFQGTIQVSHALYQIRIFHSWARNRARRVLVNAKKSTEVDAPLQPGCRSRGDPDSNRLLRPVLQSYFGQGCCLPHSDLQAVWKHESSRGKGQALWR